MVYKKGTDLEKNIKIQLIYLLSKHTYIQRLKLNATRGIKPLPHLFFLLKKQNAVERKNSYRIFYLLGNCETRSQSQLKM